MTLTNYADYTVDDLNRITSQTDFFTDPKTIRFDYGFDPLGRRQYEQRDGLGADGFKYNARDELTGYNREGTLGGTVVTGGSTVMTTIYDANGNRTKTTANGGVTTYTPNNLNQYGSTSAQGTLGYDQKGNLTTIPIPGWTYTYDAQNRLTALDSTTLNVHIRQHYDPLNRIIARDNNGVITSNVWDGWNLIEERNGSGAVQRAYLYGAAQNEVVEAFGGGAANTWYWQDGRGNTAAVSGDAGKLLERYRYGWQGTPSFYNAANGANTNQSESAFGTRFLFAGSLYQPETGLYDMRNRFYHPTLSRFLQTDPIGFKGDALNLYRYCGNDFVDRSDPDGLDPNAVAAQKARTPNQPDWQWEFAKGSDSSNRSQNTFRDTIDGLTMAQMPAGERTQEVPKEMLKKMYDASKENVRNTETKPDHGPGTKRIKQEFRTTGFRNGEDEQSASIKGYRKGENQQPVAGLPKDPFRGAGRVVWES